jgi:hypothetical protein
MLITKQNAEYFRTIETRSVEINKDIIKNRVGQITANLARLLGAANSRGDAFVRRQAKSFTDFGLRNVVIRGLSWIYTVYKTDPKSGEAIIQLCESMFAQLRAEATNKTKGDFWDLSKEESLLSMKRMQSFAVGDKQTARETHAQIQNIEREFPQYLKRVEEKKCRRSRAKVQVK